jgi:hypothetical protein
MVLPLFGFQMWTVDPATIAPDFLYVRGGLVELAVVVQLGFELHYHTPQKTFFRQMKRPKNLFMRPPAKR